MNTRSFDVVVVGGGPAGEVAAGRFADGGLEVALVEDRLVGGECSFWACMPSKALLRPAEALEEVARVPGAAEAVTGPLDAAAVLRRRDEVIHELDDSGMLAWLEDRGITLVRGHGRLAGERRVVVGEEELQARQLVVLAPGSGAAVPPIEGLREAAPWTNVEGTVAKEVPGRLLILGGGVVGCEMAQAWRSLGAEVTVIEGSSRLLAKEEPFAAEQVADGLRADGVVLHLGAKAAAVERHEAGGEVTLVLEGGERLVGDELLVAVGRRPHTDDLGLETIGLQTDDAGYVEIDDRGRVPGFDWLLAVGDVNGRALLTHMGKHQARIAAQAHFGGHQRLRETGDGSGSPRVTFTRPGVAAVGLTLEGAEDAGLDARAVDVSTDGTAGASFWGRNSGGTARLVIDDARGIVVGATITGAEVQDFLHAATIAVVAAIPLDELWYAVPAFPTRSELWLRLLEKAGL